jgi:hypothetical protein
MSATASLLDDHAEELLDYRILLGCIRKRLESYGMIDALLSLEQLDHAILQAIVEQEPQSRTIN